MQLMAQIRFPVIVATCLLASVAVIANVISFIMIGKINERLIERERISYFWWGNKIRVKFKELYPRSRLVLLLDFCVIAMILCFILLVRFWVFS